MKAKFFRKENRRTILFVACILAAGLMHSLDRMLNVLLLDEGSARFSSILALASTTLFTLNLAIYACLIVLWTISLRRRLLPSRGRGYLITAAAFMLFFLFQRAVKYRIAGYSSFLEHFCWYTFYIPLAVIPTMFLLTCLGTAVQKKLRDVLRRTVCAALILLVAAVETNDLHKLMFIPRGDLAQGGGWGTYDNGPLWYVFYGYLFLCILSGVLLLAFLDKRRGSRRQALPPVLILLLMFGMLTIADRYVPMANFPFPWAFPELCVFSMLGIFEVCIRSRLIPYNENYPGFFARLRLPAVITDGSFRPVYRTATPVKATVKQFEDALTAPAPLEGETVLYGKRLASGCAFWVGDEREMRRLEGELADIAETLESENDLLRCENEQKEARARVDARNKVYARAAAEVYPTQKMISALLERTVPGDERYAENMARILVLNAYVKRKTNFVLLSSERSFVTAPELFSALEECARFLTLAGVRAGVESAAEGDFTVDGATALFDGFEAVIETLPKDAGALMICLDDEKLRLVTDRRPEGLPGKIAARVTILEEDGQIYIDIPADGKGAKR